MHKVVIFGIICCLIGVVFSSESSTRSSTDAAKSETELLGNLAKMAKELGEGQKALRQALLGSTTKVASTKKMNPIERVCDLTCKTKKFVQNNFANLAGLVVFLAALGQDY